MPFNFCLKNTIKRASIFLHSLLRIIRCVIGYYITGNFGWFFFHLSTVTSQHLIPLQFFIHFISFYYFKARFFNIYSGSDMFSFYSHFPHEFIILFIRVFEFEWYNYRTLTYPWSEQNRMLDVISLNSKMD